MLGRNHHKKQSMYPKECLLKHQPCTFRGSDDVLVWVFHKMKGDTGYTGIPMCWLRVFKIGLFDRQAVIDDS